jgi:hypothetical protein
MLNHQRLKGTNHLAEDNLNVPTADFDRVLPELLEARKGGSAVQPS